MNCHALMISLWTLRDLRAQEDADLLWIKLIVKLVLDTSLRVGWITLWNCLSLAINLEVAWMTNLGKTANFRMAKLIQLPTTSVWTNLNWNLKVWFCFITLRVLGRNIVFPLKVLKSQASTARGDPKGRCCP